MQATLAKPSRIGSLTAVVLLHGVAISMFASGLMLRAPLPKPERPQVEVKKPDPPKLDPVPVVKVDKPVLDQFRVIEAPIPVVPRQDDAAPHISVQPSNDPTAREIGLPAGLVSHPVTEPTTVASGPVAPGMLCSRMPAPEMPASLDQAAELRVIGTVRGGRVIAVEFTAARGLSDRRALRQLQQAVDRTLREGYQCSSEGRFEQEFLFRPE